MLRFFVSAAVAFFGLSAVVAGDLPKTSMQVIEADSGRKAVFLTKGDVLQVLLPNNSGNFAEDVTVEIGKTPLKLSKMLKVQMRDDTGAMAVGSEPIALFFDATQVGTGDLTIRVKRRVNDGEKPIRLRITVEPSTNVIGNVAP